MSNEVPFSDQPSNKKRRSLADFFPEEHILVTSGIFLFVITMLAIVPKLGNVIGFLPIITLGKIPPTAQEWGIPTDWAVWMVAGIVIIVMWVASQKKT